MLDRRRPMTVEELERLARAIDPDARVLGSEPLLGGLDWGTYALELVTPAGSRSLVVRRHDGSGERPGAAARRLWTALTALQHVELPVPRPILFDEGPLLGAPIVVMTRCPGAIRPPPSAPDVWIDRYAGVLAAIQGTELGLLDGLARCPDPLAEVDRLVANAAGRESPERTTLVDLLRGTGDHVAVLDPVLRHRDLWFGNTLWSGDEVTGIVDWSGACVGEPLGDLAYARLDVHLVLGPVAARAFQLAFGRRRGPMPDSAWWELVAAADGLAWLEEWVEGYEEVGSGLTIALARQRLADFIADARSRLVAPSPRSP